VGKEAVITKAAVQAGFAKQTARLLKELVRVLLRKTLPRPFVGGRCGFQFLASPQIPRKTPRPYDTVPLAAALRCCAAPRRLPTIPFSQIEQVLFR